MVPSISLRSTTKDASTSSSEYHILKLEDDNEEEEEEGASDDGKKACWIDELPMRPMSTFCRACIDVALIVLTIAIEAGLVWMAVQDDSTTWLLKLPSTLLLMVGFLYIAMFVYLVATRDFESGRSKGSTTSDDVAEEVS
ncbi:hypothetical protein ACP4OV_011710 [Aristida adscensionis]